MASPFLPLRRSAPLSTSKLPNNALERAGKGCGPQQRAQEMMRAAAASKSWPAAQLGVISMRVVHPGFSLVVGRLAPTSFSGLARMNNPHRNHN